MSKKLILALGMVVALAVAAYATPVVGGEGNGRDARMAWEHEGGSGGWHSGNTTGIDGNHTNNGTQNGNLVVNGNLTNGPDGVINGNTSSTGNTTNHGTINGNVNAGGGVYNTGTIDGNVTAGGGRG